MAFVNSHASASRARTNRPEGKKPSKSRIKSSQAKRAQVDDQLRDLQSRVDSYVPPAQIGLFSQLPLSVRTLTGSVSNRRLALKLIPSTGLKSSHFLTPTPIQSLAIPPSLLYRDVLGSASTGSGKTLAFLIPLLERLYLLKWGPLDGLGAVVISPTRELAVQTFTQLREIGKYHSFSAGLVIGGKPLKEERERLGRMNILIATPGRLLQHLDTTVGFESSGVKVLVLDEADRLLDLGFLPALRAIISHFSVSITPSGRPDRQTLLFSATQSKDLAGLAKLSLHDPLYINCNKPGEEGVMPSNLEQFYAVIGLERKLDTLWGFVKSHLKMKAVVFVTSGKQVRFIFETFRLLHPGLPLLHLHGKQKQPTRLSTFDRFSTSKQALLICTDVAARGLDFPAVDWVIQLDCPDDVDSYVHRVGRTARYHSEGKALLFLCPSEEEGMLERWKEKTIEVKRIKIKESKMGDLKQQMQNFAFQKPEIKYLGQRAFISYMRSVHIQKNKAIFRLSQLPAEAYAASMGLPGAPRIKLLDKEGRGNFKERGGSSRTAVADPTPLDVVAISDEEDVDGDGDGDERLTHDANGDMENGIDGGPQSEKDASDDGANESKLSTNAPVRTKYDRMFERKNQSILTPHYAALVSHDHEDADEVFTLARRDHALDVEEAASDREGITQPLTSSGDLSKRKLKAGSSRKGQLRTRPAPEKVVFDDQGMTREFYEAGKDAESGAGADAKRKAYMDAERDKMRIADRLDRQVARERKKERKRKRKEREMETLASDGEDNEGGTAIIGAELDDQDVSEEDIPASRHVSNKKRKAEVDLDDEEALVLQLLRGDTG